MVNGEAEVLRERSIRTNQVRTRERIRHGVCGRGRRHQTQNLALDEKVAGTVAQGDHGIGGSGDPYELLVADGLQKAALSGVHRSHLRALRYRRYRSVVRTVELASIGSVRSECHAEVSCNAGDNRGQLNRHRHMMDEINENPQVD